MNIFLIKQKYIFSFILVAFLSYFVLQNTSNAELSYNFTKHTIKNEGANNNEKNNDYLLNLDYAKNQTNSNIPDNKESKNGNKKQPTGDTNNEIKLKIGGLAEFQYFRTKQASEYTRDILPNNQPSSPVIIKNSSIANGENDTFNMLGKIDINPEFVRYKQDDGINKIDKQRQITIGAMISQPFQKASKNTDPRLAPQEYIYVKTLYFTYHMGAVNSSASRMRVDPESIASGAGGVYGTWWRYINLPVFNTNGLPQTDQIALNAMSPTYILYPTLPNEAGFTTQRVNGAEITPAMFNGDISANNLMYGSSMQGYPTQGAYSNKISLYSNRIYGIKFGISYSPTTANTGFITKGLNQGTKVFNNMSGGFVKNYTSVALDYRKQFEKYGLGIALSISYEYGEASPLKYIYSSDGNNYSSIVVSGSPYYARHNLNAFAVGMKVVYKNYSIAYSYGYWGHSLLQKYSVIEDGKYQISNQDKRSYYHTAGIGANYGPVRFGITYMRSSFAGHKLDAWSIGTDFKMISLRTLRVQPYFEYVGYLFHTKEIQLISGSTQTFKASANRGYVITTGIKIVF